MDRTEREDERLALAGRSCLISRSPEAKLSAAFFDRAQGARRRVSAIFDSGLIMMTIGKWLPRMTVSGFVPESYATRRSGAPPRAFEPPASPRVQSTAAALYREPVLIRVWLWWAARLSHVARRT